MQQNDCSDKHVVLVDREGSEGRKKLTVKKKDQRTRGL